MDLLTSIILWSFAGILIIGWLVSFYYVEFKFHCKSYKSLNENLNAKFHGDFRLIDGRYGNYNDSGFTIGYDYCTTYYCLQCGIISHWKKGKMTVDEYVEFIDKNRFLIKKLNELIKEANKKYKLKRNLIKL